MATGLLQFFIVDEYGRVPEYFFQVPRYSSWILLISASFLSLLAVARRLSSRLKGAIPPAVLSIPMFAVLCAAPLYWACTTLIDGGDCILPYASPELRIDSVKGWRFVQDDQVDHILPSCVNPLYGFLTENRNREEFLAAVPSSHAGAALLMLYNENRNVPVMTVGGFNGNDPILSVQDLEQCVRDGKVRFVLVPSLWEHPEQPRPLLVATGGNELLYEWAIAHGKRVDRGLWDNNGLATFPTPDPLSLYDLKT